MKYVSGVETVFFVVGGVTAAWAVLLTAVGVMRPSFPAGRAGTATVMAMSAVLVAAAIGTGILAASEEEEAAHETEAAEAAEGEAEQAAEPEQEEAAGPAGGGQPGAGEELELTADPSGELAFDRTELEADSGPVTIVMDNPAPIPHDVSLEGGQVDEQGETVDQGGTSTVSAQLAPGEYTFYCSVPGHREGGMEGTLTVR